MTVTLKRKIFIALGLVMVLAAATTGFFLLRSKPSTPTVTSKGFHPVIAANALFSFNTRKAPDWNGGPANKTSMVIFKKDENCFESAELHSGTIDETQAVSKITKNMDEMVSVTGYAVTTFDPIDAMFNVRTSPAGAPYKLHPYALSGTGEHGYRTEIFGYVPLENHYIKVEAYCSDNTTFSQMVDTLSAFSLKAVE